jgi:elongation factor G
VYLKIEPLQRGSGFQFASEVKGGVIPTVFIPAVEKGCARRSTTASSPAIPSRTCR